jgi:peroxiredoxin family protein
MLTAAVIFVAVAVFLTFKGINILMHEGQENTRTKNH